MRLLSFVGCVVVLFATTALVQPQWLVPVTTSANISFLKPGWFVGVNGVPSKLYKEDIAKSVKTTVDSTLRRYGLVGTSSDEEYSIETSLGSLRGCTYAGGWIDCSNSDEEISLTVELVLDGSNDSPVVYQENIAMNEFGLLPLSRQVRKVTRNFVRELSRSGVLDEMRETPYF